MDNVVLTMCAQWIHFLPHVCPNNVFMMEIATVVRVYLVAALKSILTAMELMATHVMVTLIVASGSNVTLPHKHVTSSL